MTTAELAIPCLGRTLRVRRASGTAERMRGLIGYADLAQGEGMLIERCGAVHTMFMSFPLDLVFLDASMRVVSRRVGVVPWRFAFGGLRARATLEVRSGWLEVDAIPEGTVLQLGSSSGLL